MPFLRFHNDSAILFNNFFDNCFGAKPHVALFQDRCQSPQILQSLLQLPLRIAAWCLVDDKIAAVVAFLEHS